MFKNMEHFLNCIANFIHCVFSSEQLKHSFSVTFKCTNMKGVKRKAEQPTVSAFGFTKKVIHIHFFRGIPNV